MGRRRIVRVAAVMLAVVLLPAAYMGAYFALLRSPLIVGKPNNSRRVPLYRVSNAWVSSALAPGHQIDRLIRPGYWQ